MGKNILIVDDSVLTQKQLSMIMQNSGHKVVDIAKNGVEAVSKFSEKSQEIDIVLLDITMPLLDGIDVLKKILQIKPGLPVIMVSALGREDTVRECLALGARSFIIKPFNVEKITETVNYVAG